MINLWLVLSQQALDEYRAYRFDPEAYEGPMDSKTYKILSKMADTDNVQRMFKPVTVATKTYILFSLYLPGTARVQEAIDYLTETWPSHFIVIGAWHMDGRQAGTEWELYAEDVLYTENVLYEEDVLYPYDVLYEEDVFDENGDLLHAAGDVRFAAGTVQFAAGEIKHAIGEVQITAGTRTGNIIGTPIYPIHAQAWRLMPDQHTYDEDGNITGTISASSNADLMQVNVLQGQSLRRFT